MSARPPPLSVVIPVYNEERTLAELHTRLGAALPREAEVLFVDDGSTDASPAALAGIAAADARVRVVRLRRNRGKSAALEAGFRRARGELVATIDADLQEDPAEIARLADKLALGYDLACAWRRPRRDPWLKVLGSRLFNFVVSLAGGARFHDINCGLKVMRREVLEDVPLAGGFHRFIPLIASWHGHRVAEVEVAHGPRRHGRSRYGSERILRGLVDLLVVLFLLRYEGRPGRFFILLGTAAGLAGTAISAYIAYLRLAFGTIQSRFPLLALGLVLIIVGVQLFSLGLFGELLAYHFRLRRGGEPPGVELEAEVRAAGAAAREPAGGVSPALPGARWESPAGGVPRSKQAP
jgi:glycosyltransferase involved in cell wall biosynthesis